MAEQLLHVGIGEMRHGITGVLVAAHLGSCLGVAVYDPQQKRGALAHCLLPLSRNHAERAAESPFVCVDTGIASLLDIFLSGGSVKRNLRIWLAGCAQVIAGTDHFEIGKKNITVAKKLLWKNDLLVAGEHTGGTISRSLFLDLSTGEASVRVQQDTMSLTGVTFHGS